MAVLWGHKDLNYSGVFFFIIIIFRRGYNWGYVLNRYKWCQFAAGLQVSRSVNSVSSGNDWRQDCLNSQIEQIQLSEVTHIQMVSSPTTEVFRYQALPRF